MDIVLISWNISENIEKNFLRGSSLFQNILESIKIESSVKLTFDKPNNQLQVRILNDFLQ